MFVHIKLSFVIGFKRKIYTQKKIGNLEKGNLVLVLKLNWQKKTWEMWMESPMRW